MSKRQWRSRSAKLKKEGISSNHSARRKLKKSSIAQILRFWQAERIQGGASPGGIISYLINIYNPDPTPADELFMHVWVGSGNADPTVGTFLLNVDTRFPRLLQPTASGGGLRIAPNTITWLQFDLAVPTNVERANYMGQSCLIHGGWNDVGQYLDRGMFVFSVT
jgi:hypothetical protein